MYALNVPELPENESRRLGQLLVDMLKRNSFQKCMASGIHSGKVVQGHLVPRTWLNAIAETREVFVFAPYSPDRGLITGDMPDIPIKEHVNNALTRYFTCTEHEKVFFPIDKHNPDLSDLKNIHLMLYRAILAQLWLEVFLQRAFKRLASESPENAVFQSMVQIQLVDIRGLRHYRSMTERCLEPNTCGRCQGGPCQVIGHHLETIEGESLIAACQFSSGSRFKLRTYNVPHPYVEKISNWGITVIPTSKGHTFIYHYFLSEQGPIQAEVEYISTLKGKKLETYISAKLLSDCENIAVSSSFWEGLDQRRQQAIRDRFENDLPDVGIGSSDMIERWKQDRMYQTGIVSVPNPNQINLFRAT